MPTLNGGSGRQRQPRQAFRVVFAIAGLLVLPAALTLRTVVDPGKVIKIWQALGTGAWEAFFGIRLPIPSGQTSARSE